MTVDLDRLIAQHEQESGAIVGLLQDIQQAEGYLPRQALEQVAEHLDIPLVQLYGLATFYRAFHLRPRGKHTVTCCMGTACHVRGAPRVAQALERELGIAAGGTTADLQVNLDTVNCVGACALGPLLVVDGRYHGGMTPTKAQRLVRRLRGKGEGDEAGDA